ncbi:MAG: hypothetical protein E7281_00075 [Lachnospiraceae bacterium]|nr:hypothetical protein [Lachnospiraceae bacterium]
MNKMALDKQLYVDEIILCLKLAVDNFYDKDKYLVEIEPSSVSQELYDQYANKEGKKKYVGERAAEFRIAYYLQNIVLQYSELKEFVVDCEYNNNGFTAKRVGDRNAFPDIIVHKRGHNDHNLLVVELKTYWNKNNNDDIKKLKYLTDQRRPYKYAVGISLVLEKTKNECKMIIVKDGEIQDSI